MAVSLGVVKHCGIGICGQEWRETAKPPRVGARLRRQGHRFHEDGGLLDPGPVELPKDWVKRVNHAESPAEVEAMRKCIIRGSPYGDEAWVKKTAKKLGLQATLRPRGRPRKKSKKQL